MTTEKKILSLINEIFKVGDEVICASHYIDKHTIGILGTVVLKRGYWTLGESGLNVCLVNNSAEVALNLSRKIPEYKYKELSELFLQYKHEKPTSFTTIRETTTIYYK